jgi:hypothetical protein
MPDGVCHRQDRQPEGQRDSHESDSNAGKRCSQDSATATTQNEPEGSDKLRSKTIGQFHLLLPFCWYRYCTTNSPQRLQSLAGNRRRSRLLPIRRIAKFGGLHQRSVMHVSTDTLATTIT